MAKTKNNSKKSSKNLFPVTYNGKEYLESECDDTFLCFYNGREMLNDLGGVYMDDGEWIYPDGTTEEY